jgi:hypothetical protein
MRLTCVCAMDVIMLVTKLSGMLEMVVLLLPKPCCWTLRMTAAAEEECTSPASFLHMH